MSEKSGGLLGFLPFGKSTKKKSKKKGAPKAAEPEILWTTRLEIFWTALRKQIAEIVSSLRSPDRPTRRMAIVFVASCLGLATFSVLTIRHFVLLRIERNSPTQASVDSPRAQSENSKQLSDFMSKQADAAHRKFSTQTLGEFALELKPMPGQVLVPGVVNMATLEIVLECDSRETAEFIEENMTQARNQVTNVLTALEREELMSREGKKRLKKALILKLNTWLHKGKVEGLFFSKLLIG